MLAGSLGEVRCGVAEMRTQLGTRRRRKVLHDQERFQHASCRAVSDAPPQAVASLLAADRQVGRLATSDKKHRGGDTHGMIRYNKEL